MRVRLIDACVRLNRFGLLHLTSLLDSTNVSIRCHKRNVYAGCSKIMKLRSNHDTDYKRSVKDKCITSFNY